MANVRPFFGITYDALRIGGDLARVTTPPYDQIGAAEVEAFHKKHPHSYIRLILAKKTESDSDTDNRYTRARDTLQEWLKERVLWRDERESFYVYRQNFTVEGKQHMRTGLMASVHYEDPDKGVILRHERTLPKHVDDRLNLLRETRTQFESIFLLYDDPQKTTQQHIDIATAGPPDLELTDEVGTRHRVWAINDAVTLEVLRAFFGDRVLLIADGHHRYQTTGLYHQETGREQDAWVLATLFPVDDAGLVILPTHRVVKNVANFDSAKLRAALQEDFVVEPWSGDANSLCALMKDREAKAHCFGMYDRDSGFAMLTLRDEERLARYLPEGHSLDWMKLDVSILHRLILDQLLGISMEAVAREGNLEYKRWPKDAVALVKSGQAQAVFMLNATRPTQVRDLATRGELMPQKSTDFYPKLLSGLVAMPLAEVPAFTPRR